MKRLFTSSKAILTLVSIVCSAFLVGFDKLSPQFFTFLVTVTVVGYQAATALEDRAASGRVRRAAEKVAASPGVADAEPAAVEALRAELKSTDKG
jgi:hypothetical protein